MIVCHCKVVRDRDIASAIDSGAATVDAIGEMCGAGRGCGACHEYIADMISTQKSDGAEDCLRIALPLLSDAA